MLPQKFCERMKKLLGDEYSEFEAALAQPPVRAFRLNRLKADEPSPTLGATTQIPYVKDGYIPKISDGIGNTPEHHAGMIYVQDPGAMATLGALDIPEGAWALDTCAAPGGKASQLAAAVGSAGFLMANEYVPKRAKIIVSNFERLGIRNAIVTSLDTAEFPKLFRGVFDVVLCDAPCSGEGMFRKCDDALTEWSEENIEKCARRQLEILENSIGALKGGGHLLYSTCTYAPEENEQVVLSVLERHPELRLVPVREELKSATSDGINVDGNHPELKLCRRFYPHISKGEGQFIALFQKDENTDDLPTILYKEQAKSPDKKEIAVINKFFADNMNEIPQGRLIKQGSCISILPDRIPLPPYSVFMCGVTVGEIKGELLFPHHQFFSAYGKDMKRQLELSCESEIQSYLHGEEIDAKGLDGGWCAVTYRGSALGGGKVSASRMKNHYPKGLRLR